MWKIINRERKKRKDLNEGIELEEWKEYFIKIMEGVKRRVRLVEEKRKMERKVGKRVMFGRDKESNKGDKGREDNGSGSDFRGGVEV